MESERDGWRLPRALAVVLVLAVAGWLRGWTIAADPLAVDEYGTLWCVTPDEAGECWRRAMAIQGQTPLYYLLVHGTVGLLGESYLTLRLPSLLAGLAVPLLGFVGATRAFGRRAGLAVLLLLALHLELVVQARAARPYPMAAACALASFVGVTWACAGAAPWARLLAWSGAVLATYFHPLFGPTLLLVPVAALAVPARARAWTPRQVLAEGAVAALCALPAVAHALRLFGRRHELAYVHELHLERIIALVFPPVVACVLIASSLLAATGRARRAARGGPSAFAAAGAAVPLLLVVALWAAGASISVERYLALPMLCALLLVGRALARLPRAAATAALVALATWQAAELRRLPGLDGARYLHCHETLRAAGAREDDVVLLKTSFVEGELVVDEARWTQDRYDFVCGPHTLEPGRRLTTPRFVVLPGRFDLGDARLAAHLRARVAPQLEGRRRFFAIGPRAWCQRVDAWVDRHFAGRFRCAHRSDDRNVFVVHRYDEAP